MAISKRPGRRACRDCDCRERWSWPRRHVYEVREARDASEALRVVSEQKPDACVIDIGLPDMNGYELARKLREIPGTRNSRLVAVSGYGKAEDNDDFMQAGFDHYLVKPRILTS